MARSDRLFEIIQLLRRAKRPVTADWLADTLEVTPRTIYRDIAALQAMRVPVAGEAGIGYVMRPGFDLPPLMFSADEAEAIVVGLALLGRTGDRGLQRAARSVSRKLGNVVPREVVGHLDNSSLRVSDYGAPAPENVELEQLRTAVRSELKLRIHYKDTEGRKTRRVILPLAIIYYVEVVIVAAWCELRNDFRHFRVDRMHKCELMNQNFGPVSKALRAKWTELHARALPSP